MAEAIKCPECGMVSFNPNDVREGYCGNCHAFTAGEVMQVATDKSRRVRPKPCASCPYRCDVPSGVWHPDEYAKLEVYDRRAELTRQD